MDTKRLIAVVTLIIGCFVFNSAAQTKIPVKFARGASSATVSGKVTGYKYIDYTISASAGQEMTIKAASSHAGLEALLLRPDGSNVDGMFGETDWTGTLPDTGKYSVRMLIPRSAARRNETANFKLTISIR